MFKLYFLSVNEPCFTFNPHVSYNMCNSSGKSMQVLSLTKKVHSS